MAEISGYSAGLIMVVFMRKKIDNMVEPVLLDLFDSFDFGGRYSIMEIKSKLNKLFNQIDNKKNKFTKLSNDEYFYLCRNHIYKFNRTDEFMHILRCILRVQRDINDRESILRESYAMLWWVEKFYKLMDREYLIDDDGSELWKEGNL